MKLSAQLYSVRDHIQTPEDMGETLKKLAAMGYETVQMAGASIDDAYLLRDLSQEAGVKQICPNLSMEDLLENMDASLEKLKILDCDAVMLPFLPTDPLVTLAGTKKRWEKLLPATEKLLDAGIAPAYHNHDFEFSPLYGYDGCFFDMLLEEHPNWQFILDVCWAQYAGVDVLACMDKIGAKRLKYVHFKDMTNRFTGGHKPVFCACGEGIVDLKTMAAKARELGVAEAIVEQDNANRYPDAFQEMAKSAAFMKPLL